MLVLLQFCIFFSLFVQSQCGIFYDNEERSKLPVEFNFGHFKFVISKNNLSMPGCGLTGFGRIVGGKDAIEGAYPFATLLLRQNRPFGGAVIMNHRWILTAAHNFHSSTQPDHFSIGIGSVDIDNLMVVSVEKILIHPLYQRKQKFDIALMKLKNPLKFNQMVKPVCLPEYSFQPIESAKARVIGWGYKQFTVKKVSTILQVVDLDIISLEQCQRMYAPIKQEIIRSQICTWSHKMDACSGDSGGPLFVYSGERAILYGLVSFGVTCADQYPGVYTAVSYYLNWISKIIREN